jgi:hypothetical protein
VRSASSTDSAHRDDDLLELCSWLPEGIASRFELKVFGTGHLAKQVETFAKSIHADLIVASQPAARSAADVLSGTFAERLVRHSGCPVLTVNASSAVVRPHAQRTGRPDCMRANC